MTRSPPICPACGQPLPPADVELQGPVRNRIYACVKQHPHGVTAEQLIAAVYFDDPNGGPRCAANVISATVWHINQRLKAYGVRIHGGRGGRGARYRLVPR